MSISIRSFQWAILHCPTSFVLNGEIEINQNQIVDLVYNIELKGLRQHQTPQAVKPASLSETGRTMQVSPYMQILIT